VLRLSARLREKIGLLLMLRIGQSFHHDGEKLTQQQLSRNLDIAAEALSLVIKPLKENGLITESCDRKRVFMPGRSLEHIRIGEILDTVRSAQESTHLKPDNVASDASVDNLLLSINESVNSTIGDMTLLDLVERSADPG
jgi:membrane protein